MTNGALLVVGADQVEGGACLEPCPLLFVVSVAEGDVIDGAILVVGDERELGTRGELGETDDVEHVLFLDLVVVGGVLEGEGEHALLLEVRFVDAGEALHDHGLHAEEARFHGSMFAAGAFTVVLVTDNDGARALGLVNLRKFGDFLVFTALAEDLVRFAVECVHGADEHVVRNVFEMTAVVEPRTGHGDVVGGALALGLDEDRGTSDVLAVPSGERGEGLEALAFGVDGNGNLGTVFGRSLVAGVLDFEALRRQFALFRRIKLHGLAFVIHEGVGHRVEADVAAEGCNHGHERGGDECMRVRVAVGALGEVAVKAVDDGVEFLLVGTGTVPTANARAAGVRHNRCTELLEQVDEAVAFGGVAHLFAPRVDEERALRGKTLGESLLDHVRSHEQVFVAGVCAAADEGGAYDRRRFRLRFGSLEAFGHIGHGVGAVRAERAVEVRHEFAQVDFHDAVKVLFRICFDFGVGLEVFCNLVGGGGNVGAAGHLEVAAHGIVVAEGGACCAHFGTHVGNRCLASSGKAASAFAKVFDNSVRATLNSQDACELEDDVLGSSEALELAGELHADHLRVLEFPREADHRIDSVCTAHANREHAEAASVHGVGVGTNHHSAREGVVFEHHLVDDACTREPAVNAVLGRDGLQEIVHFLAFFLGARKVLFDTFTSDNQVVAVHGARHGHAGLTGGGELQKGHLGGSVLHGHAVGVEFGKILAAFISPVLGAINQVAVDNLFGEGERTAQLLAGSFNAGGNAGIHALDHVEIEKHNSG